MPTPLVHLPFSGICSHGGYLSSPTIFLSLVPLPTTLPRVHSARQRDGGKGLPGKAPTWIHVFSFHFSSLGSPGGQKGVHSPLMSKLSECFSPWTTLLPNSTIVNTGHQNQDWTICSLVEMHEVNRKTGDSQKVSCFCSCLPGVYCSQRK